jgi:hypothetical protein
MRTAAPVAVRDKAAAHIPDRCADDAAGFGDAPHLGDRLVHARHEMQDQQ